MEKADAEGPSRRPAGRGLKPSEGKFSGAPALLGDGEDGDENGEQAGKSPEDGKGLWFHVVSVWARITLLISRGGRLAALTSRRCR